MCLKVIYYYICVQERRNRIQKHFQEYITKHKEKHFFTCQKQNHMPHACMYSVAGMMIHYINLIFLMCKRGNRDAKIKQDKTRKCSYIVFASIHG